MYFYFFEIVISLNDFNNIYDSFMSIFYGVIMLTNTIPYLFIEDM